MLEGMMVTTREGAHLLVLDTCGERASLALFSQTQLLAEAWLEQRTASASLLGGIREILRGRHMGVTDLSGIGVVRGPGSFTGVRVGLAIAKGLCEAGGVPVAGVSRLAVLAQTSGLAQGFALLGAGRDQIYVREVADEAEPREFMADLREFEPRLRSAEIAVASSELAARLRERVGAIHLVDLSARHAIGAVWACFARGGSTLATLDANYVRNEDAIYRQASAQGKSVHA